MDKHKILEISSTTEEKEHEKQLDELSKQGWELVSSIPVTKKKYFGGIEVERIYIWYTFKKLIDYGK